MLLLLLLARVPSPPWSWSSQLRRLVDRWALATDVEPRLHFGPLSFYGNTKTTGYQDGLRQAFDMGLYVGRRELAKEELWLPSLICCPAWSRTNRTTKKIRPISPRCGCVVALLLLLVLAAACCFCSLLLAAARCCMLLLLHAAAAAAPVAAAAPAGRAWYRVRNSGVYDIYLYTW